MSSVPYIPYQPPSKRRSTWRVGPEISLEDVYEGPSQTSDSSLRQLVESVRREHRLPAMGALVLRPETVRDAVSGRRRNGAEEAVKDGDMFHLGSCAKAMTATLIARLVEDGLLLWSSTLAGLFPDLANGMHPSFKDVTVEMLTSHISGLPANFSLELRKRMYREYVDRQELLRLVTQEPPSTPPGKDFVYSNAGYVLAGAVVERVTGQSRCEDVLRARLFSPLGMCRAGFGPAGLEQPWGHRDDGTPVPPDWDVWRRNPDNYPPDNPPSMAPAGGVHASLNDWARFASAHVRRADNILSQESWRYLQTPLPGRGYTPGGWGVGPAGELIHTGSNTLYFAMIRLRTDERTAVLTVANQAGENGPAGCARLSHQLL